jgi:hypothetical protein
MFGMSPFFEALLTRHEAWPRLPLVEREGRGWQGTALIVPPLPESDLVGGLDIEEVGAEITISLDHSHIHMGWPLSSMDQAGDVWADPIAMIDAILCERVLSASGWIDGKLRVGSLHKVGEPLDLMVPKLQRLRIRSWRGTFDRDDVLREIPPP